MIRRATLGKGNAWLAFAAIPFLWTAMEFAIARIPGFPWDLLGYSQIDNGLLTRLAPWTGVYGISFLLAIGNALLSAGWVLRRRTFAVSRPPAIVVGLSGKAFGAYGVVLVFAGMRGAEGQALLRHPPVQAMAMLVQPNLSVASDDVWVGPEWDRHIDQFKSLAAEQCKDYIAGTPETGAPSGSFKCGIAGPFPDLIVWPESPAPFRDVDPKFQSSMASLAKLAPLIVGTIGMDSDPATQQYRIYNSAAVFAQDGHLAGRYDKIHLVPFGEYVPHRELLFFIRQIAQSLTDITRVSEPTARSFCGISSLAMGRIATESFSSVMNRFLVMRFASLLSLVRRSLSISVTMAGMETRARRGSI